MIHFTQLLIDKTNTVLNIKADLDECKDSLGTSCFVTGAVTVDEIYIMTQKSFNNSFTPPVTLDQQTIEDLAEKGIAAHILDSTEKASIFDQTTGWDIQAVEEWIINAGITYKDNILFVYIKTNADETDVPGTITQSCANEGTDLGLKIARAMTYNSYDLFTLVINNYTKNRTECCTMSDKFINQILDINRFTLSVQSRNMKDAIEAWNVLHDGCKKTVKTCNCNG